MEKYYRMVIEIYKKSITDKKIDENAITEAQRELNFAIDKATINNEPTAELEALKNDLAYLKYDLQC